MSNNKGEIFKYMMRRPETAKLIREAMNSPVGSTSRTKAKKLFSIMNKLNNYNDGTGGPGGMMYDQGNMGQQQTPEIGQMNVPMGRMKGMVIFHKIPKPKINYSYPKKDGGGGPGIKDGQGGPSPIMYVSGTPPKETLPTLSFSGLNLNPSTPVWQGGSIVGNTPTIPPVSSPSGGLTWKTGINPQTKQGEPGYGLISTYPVLNRPLSTDIPSKPTGEIQPLGWSGEPSPVLVSSTGDPYADNWTKYGGETVQKPPVVPTGPTQIGSTGLIQPGITPTVTTKITGYGGEITPAIKDKKISELTYQEQQTLYEAQKAREGSTLPNNPFGIKAGPATNHWVNEGKAVLGSKGIDGGQFLIFKDEDTVNAAYQELLYGNNYANLTVDEAMKKWSNYGLVAEGTPSKYAELASAVKSGISQNLGAGLTAFEQMMNKNDPITLGMTAEQKIAQQDIEARKKWDIDALTAEKKRKEQEKLNLPQDIVEFIRARDQYIVQTDKAIADYKEYMRTSMDMSNPINAQAANEHLNYLYTLRGRQNQSYMGYLNQAIDQHQRSLDTITDNYNTALASYEREIKATAAITAGQYQLYIAALSDMYKEVQDAPTRALQLQYLQAQVFSAGKLTPEDMAKAGYLEQSKKLEGEIITSDRMIMPEIDLMKKVQELAISDPQISTQNIIQTYVTGVSNYLSAQVEKDEFTGTGITDTKKISTAKRAIQQLAYLAAAYAPDPTTGQGGDPTSYLGSINAAKDIAAYLNTDMANNISSSGKAPQLMEAVKTLAPKGIFGGAKTPPTEAEFIKTVINKTKDPADESIAKAIYAVFQEYIIADGNKTTSPAGAVNALLYNTSSTGTATTPFTPDEFSQNIGVFYANNIMNDAFTQK